jgi:hypothetical protein
MKDNMIIVRLSGGMGNQMFQYALGRAMSLKYNVPLGLDMAYLFDRTPRPNFTFRDYYLDSFNIDPVIVSRKQIPFLYRLYGSGKIRIALDTIRRKFLKPRGTEKNFTFDKNVFDLGPNAYLDGYWQSPKYFKGYEDIIRKDFTFRDALPEPWETLTAEIKGCNSVCLHVRRGDYVTNPFHDIDIGQSFYDRGLHEIATRAPIDRIYVFSDDIKWCESNLKFAYPTVFVGDEYVGEKDRGHFALMSSCKHFMICNSTFSWWAAWLGASAEKIVVAPQKWFADPSVDTSDIFPADWIKVA